MKPCILKQSNFEELVISSGATLLLTISSSDVLQLPTRMPNQPFDGFQKPPFPDAKSQAHLSFQYNGIIFIYSVSSAPCTLNHLYYLQSCFTVDTMLCCYYRTLYGMLARKIYDQHVTFPEVFSFIFILNF